MRVKMLEDRRLKTGRITKICPKGETVLVADDVAAEWIEAGVAEPVVSADVTLTPEETAVLKRAAGAIIDEGRETLAGLDFEQMKIAELQAVAAELQLDTATLKRKADLVAALEARRAEVLGISELTREPV